MNDKMHDAMQQISDQHLQEAEHYQARCHPVWLSAAAAVLALILVLTPILTGMVNTLPPIPTISGTQPADNPALVAPQSPHTLQLANLVAAPEYPEMAQKPDKNAFGSDHTGYNTAMSAWQASQRAQYSQQDGYANSLTPFFTESIRKFLNGEENGAYSPVNVYMALALLAETTDGNSRQQILDLLGLETIEDLRLQVSQVWNAHYSTDGETTLILGNSLWLSDKCDFRQETLDRLASTYYASSFHGEMGSESLNGQLQQWLNSQTGGLLSDKVASIKLDADTVFALASSVYFSAGWDNEFIKSSTKNDVFHCEDADLITAFMTNILFDSYYYGTHFDAVKLGLSGGNNMWLILPDEGHSVSEILASDEYMQMIQAPYQWENKYSYMKIHLKVPKFDISSDLDLKEGLKELGITDVFNDTVSDFSAITGEENLFVGAVKHAARVKIDEEGCVGAAFTMIYTYGTGNTVAPPEEIYFTLDRPFVFIVSSRDHLPLFAGVVAQP